MTSPADPRVGLIPLHTAAAALGISPTIFASASVRGEAPLSGSDRAACATSAPPIWPIF